MLLNNNRTFTVTLLWNDLIMNLYLVIKIELDTTVKQSELRERC